MTGLTGPSVPASSGGEPAPFEDADATRDGEELYMLEGAPDYADLLDDAWLERAADLDELQEEAPVDFGVTLDLNGPDDDEELAQILDLDVGSLLTSLPSDSELDLDGLGAQEGSFTIGVLHDVMLPEERLQPERSDEEVGDDDRFPVFEESLGLATRRPAADLDDDAVADEAESDGDPM
jgi:hypothetical protein